MENSNQAETTYIHTYTLQLDVMSTEKDHTKVDVESVYNALQATFESIETFSDVSLVCDHKDTQIYNW